jgi:hypothetical protein
MPFPNRPMLQLFIARNQFSERVRNRLLLPLRVGQRETEFLSIEPASLIKADERIVLKLQRSRSLAQNRGSG